MPHTDPITLALLVAYFVGLLTVLGRCARRDLAPFRPGRHRAPRRTARLVVAALALAVAAGGTLTTRPAAAADATADTVPASWVKPGQIEPPVMHVDRADLAPVYADRVAGTRWLLVEFNDGRLVVLRACRAEDGRRCWWDASRRGNGIGFSWLRYAGQVHRMPDRSNVTADDVLA